MSELCDPENDSEFDAIDCGRLLASHGIAAPILTTSGLMVFEDLGGRRVILAPLMSRVARWLGY